MTDTITLTSADVRNAVSLSADNTLMDVEINHPDAGWIPYTIHPSDTDMTIDNAALKTLIGTNFTAFSQADSDTKLAARIRGQRDGMLSDIVDPVVTNPLRWADLTTAKQNEWTAYRTALLDVPDQSGFPNTITWPTKPE